MDLDGLRCGRHREAAGLQLGHRRLLEERLARVAQVRGAVGEPPRRLQLGGDVGQLELDRLEASRSAARTAPAAWRSPIARSSTAWVRLSDSAAIEMRPTSSVRRNWASPRSGSPTRCSSGTQTSSKYSSRVSRPRQPMPRIFGPMVKPGGVLLDHEGRELRCLRLGRRAGQQRHAEGHVGAGVGDERLPAVDHPAAVAPLGPGADAAGVGTGVGLGQAEGAERPALRQRSEPALPLLVVAEQEERQRPDRHVGLPRRGHRLVGQAELLHGGDEADGGHADAAPLLGDQHAEQAQRAHLAEQVGGADAPPPTPAAPGAAISFWAKSRQSPTRSRSASVSEKSMIARD